MKRMASMYNVAKDCEVKNLAEIYNKYFDDSYKGIFIEIGAYDGKTGSNVSGLAENGWTGYCFEPESNNFQQLVSFYKNNENILCFPIAIGKEGIGKLFINHSYSTTSDEQYELYKKHHWMGGDEPCITINKISFNKILEDLQIKSIDVLSIDTEGTELEVLQTFDIDKYQPKIAIIEAHQNHPLEGFGRYAEEINLYFLNAGYEIIYSDFVNNVYVQKNIFIK